MSTVSVNMLHGRTFNGLKLQGQALRGANVDGRIAHGLTLRRLTRKGLLLQRRMLRGSKLDTRMVDRLELCALKRNGLMLHGRTAAWLAAQGDARSRA